MMAGHSFLGWIVIGLVAGILGKIIMPGKDPGGIIVTILIGIAGALLAGFIAPKLGISYGAVWWQSYAAATVGAVVLLVLYRIVTSRRS